MGFNDFKRVLTIRVVLIAISIALTMHLIYSDSYFVTTAVVLAAVVWQVWLLIQYVDRGHQEMQSFLQMLKNGDFSVTYAAPEGASSFQATLYAEFNEVIRRLRQLRSQRHAEFQYMKTIVQHVGIGIITFDTRGDVQIVNTAARKLFHLKKLDSIEQLRSLSHELVEAFYELRTGGRNLIKFERDGEEQQLSVFAMELSLRGKTFKLVSLQNIRTELEEKEMEAWQNLVRVLTHEIMNSVTPISSLAQTADQELVGMMEHGEDPCAIGRDDIEDVHLAVQTIHKRSEGLIRFVSDFRNLARVPTPNLQEVSARELLEDVVRLMEPDLRKGNISPRVRIEPPDLAFKADAHLIMQVLINLVKNAVQALEKEPTPTLELLSLKDAKRGAKIIVRDNGVGIEEEALKRIFIPFYTTRKQGSGIGLSLSKQIMRKHGGSITVKSKQHQGTEFTLHF